MAEVGRTFVRPESRQGQRDDGAQLVECPCAGSAQDGLEFREAEFDGIEIRTVRREKSQRGAGRFDRAADVVAAMRREIVENNDVTGPKCGHEDLRDIGRNTAMIDRPIDHARRRDALEP